MHLSFIRFLTAKLGISVPTQAADVSTLSTGGCGAASLSGSCSLGSRRVSTAGSNPDRCRARLRHTPRLDISAPLPFSAGKSQAHYSGQPSRIHSGPTLSLSLSLSLSLVQLFVKISPLQEGPFARGPESHLRVEFINNVGEGSNLLVTAYTERTQRRADPGSQLLCGVGSVVTGLLAARDIVGEVFEAATIRLSTAASRKAFLSSGLSLTLSPSSRDEGNERFWQPRHCCWIVQRPTLLCTYTRTMNSKCQL